MASIITGQIATQKFELIRDRIGEILLTELTAQGAMYSPQEVFANKVYIERFVPIDHTNFPALNIVLANGDYSNKDQLQADGLYKFWIVCYTGEKSTATQDGDTRATLRMHRILGLCRAILNYGGYRTLGFAPTEVNVKTTYVGSIVIPKVDENGDAVNAIMGYLEFFVKAPEVVNVVDPVQLLSSAITVKLYDTDEGYYWGYNPDFGSPYVSPSGANYVSPSGNNYVNA